MVGRSLNSQYCRSSSILLQPQTSRDSHKVRYLVRALRSFGRRCLGVYALRRWDILCKPPELYYLGSHVSATTESRLLRQKHLGQRISILPFRRQRRICMVIWSGSLACRQLLVSWNHHILGICILSHQRLSYLERCVMG